MVWFIIVSHILLLLAGCFLLIISFHILNEIWELKDCMYKPRTTCEEVNQFLPWLVGIHWLVTAFCLFIGHPYMALYHLPIGLLYIFQYRQWVPESGYGFYNPIRFCSKKYLQGLQSVFSIISGFYLVSMIAYFSSMMVSLINYA